jgi:hypothetical protein
MKLALLIITLCLMGPQFLKAEIMGNIQKLLLIVLPLNCALVSLAKAEPIMTSYDRKIMRDEALELHKKKLIAPRVHNIIFRYSDQNEAPSSVTFINPQITNNNMVTFEFHDDLDYVALYSQLLAPNLQKIVQISHKRGLPSELSFFILGIEAYNRYNTIHQLEEFYEQHVPNRLRSFSIMYDRNFWSATVGPGGRSPFILCELYSKNYIRNEFDTFLEKNNLTKNLTAEDREFLDRPMLTNTSKVSSSLADAISHYIFSTEGGFEVSLGFAQMVADEMGFQTLGQRANPLTMMKIWAAWMEYLPQDHRKFVQNPTALLDLLLWGVPKPYINHYEGYNVILFPAYKNEVARVQELLFSHEVDLSTLDEPLILN